MTDTSYTTDTESTWLLHDEERQASALRSSPSYDSLASCDSLSAKKSPDGKKATPVPWRPLLILWLLNTAQPIAFELIFPFVNQMILEIGVVNDPTKVGFYSGLIESIFAMMSFCTIMPLGLLSDRYGRKPVILWGILGLSVSVACFGLSKSFASMVLTRCIGGVLGGLWSAMRIMAAELTDKSNQSIAFSGLGASYRIGQIVGHPLGGWFVHPERRWSLFRTSFWCEYPFSLPCFIAGGIGAGAVILGFFNLTETLPSKRCSKYTISRESSTDTLVDYSAIELPTTKGPRPSIRSVLTPCAISVLCNNMTMVLTSEVLAAVYPLFAFTPIESGGLGLDEATIGTHTAIRAVFVVGFMLAFPVLQSKLGTFGLYKLTMLAYPLTVLGFPVLNQMAMWGLGSTFLFKSMSMLFFCLWAFASLSWTAQGAMVTDVSPSAEALSTINSISGMSIAIPQTLAPWLATSAFAFSLELYPTRGGLFWLISVA